MAQISDGQPQAAASTKSAVAQISDGQPQAAASTKSAVAQISDGQPQAAPSTKSAVSQISDGQPQASVSKTSAVSQLSDGQPQASGSSVAAVSQSADGQPAASGTQSGSGPAPTKLVTCASDSTLALTLDNGVLKDAKGRTGYIASNYQFQFDNPPQAGALYTSGFSVCGNGSLALGGSAVFYQCLSGTFFNLYDRYWAPQCNPVLISTLELQACP